MSTSLDYWTSEKIAPALRRKIEKAANAFIKSRRWWSESLCFFKWPGKEDRLAGSTKIMRLDVNPTDDLFMTDRDMLAIIDQLSQWSTEYGVGWELQLAGLPWGNIQK